MILALHIGIAVFSLVFAAYGLFSPSKTKLIINYFMIAATLITGTLLVVSAPAHMTTGCTVGLFYTLAMVTMSVVVKRKLQTERV